MDNSHDIKVTNTLIATTLDSMKGYQRAAEDSEVTTHVQFFREMADERSRVASDLQAHVRALGGDPETDSSTTGSAHRGWLDLKEAITGKDESTVIKEVERGEDYIRDKFQAAIRDDDLSPQTRGVFEKCMESIRKGHDRASALKHALAD